MKTEDSRQADTRTEALARNADGTGLGVETDVTARVCGQPALHAHRTAAGWFPAKRGMRRSRAKAELAREIGLMEAVRERDNLMIAYQRVTENKGSAEAARQSQNAWHSDGYGLRIV